MQKTGIRVLGHFIAVLVLALLPASAVGINLDQSEQTINKWVREFQPSALAPDEQREQLKWFRETARPLQGMTIKSVAETLNIHLWERDVLAKAFDEITGIRAECDIVDEGDVVRRITEQMLTGRVIHHVYVNDADWIGTHLRWNKVVDLGKYMQVEGKAYTNPRLYLDGFLNLQPAQDYEGNQLQLPDQQFPVLYWFRHDWFTDPKAKAAFKAKYG